MIAKLSVLAGLMAMAMAAPSPAPSSSITTTTTATSATGVPPTKTSSATTPSSSSGPTGPAPVLKLPPFNGQFQNQYPPEDEVAPTDTALVKQWLSELNLTGVPNLPVVPFGPEGDPKDPGSIAPDACDWTVDNCINGDLTVCPLGVWGLTFDDGPTQYSDKLYDFLDQTQQKATLFYIGANVVQHWQSARRACEAGHHLAVHTWSHHPSTSLTNAQFVAEVKYTELAIKEVCGVTTRYFRPPYGDIDNRIRGLLTAMGYTDVIWDYDTDDWMMPPGGSRSESQVDSDFAKWIAHAPNDTTGHITLQHELYQSTVDAAIKNLPAVQQTWKTMPVAACMNDPHPYLEKNISLATLDGKYSTGVSNNTTNNTAGSPPAANNSITAAGSGAGGNTSAGVSATAGQRLVSLALSTTLLATVVAMLA